MSQWNADSVKSHIEGLARMKDLELALFTEEGGMADCLAEEFGKSRKLKATQLRRVFHTLKNVRRGMGPGSQFDRSALLPIMPVLAYAAGRELLPPEFYHILRLCLGQQRLQNAEDFIRTVDFVEAIMAYHKYRYPKGG
jgi:CRISPR-associated protein Csm2